jgi:geranylgeranyl pyrophosphate synthase
MKAVERDVVAESALADLLDQTFLSGDDQESVLARSVPAAIWNDALLNALRDFLRRPSKGFRAGLVALGYKLAGGDPEAQPIELPLIIECIHAGSLIIDDIEDESVTRRAAPALHHAYGVPRALNAGNWLYFWPQVLLGRLALPDSVRLAMHERLALCLMHCHEGQALDLSVRVSALPRRDVPTVVRAITQLKTGALLRLATALGALAAGASSERVEAIGKLGCELGVGLQMLDDLSGVLNPSRRHKALEDLHHGRATWLWAWLAEELDRQTYEALQRDADAVVAGGASDAFFERTRFRIGTHGLKHARKHVQLAVQELTDIVGGASGAQDVLEQFAWLERRYVQS